MNVCRTFSVMTAGREKSSSFVLLMISPLRCRGLDQEVSNWFLFLITQKGKILGILAVVMI